VDACDESRSRPGRRLVAPTCNDKLCERLVKSQLINIVPPVHVLVVASVTGYSFDILANIR